MCIGRLATASHFAYRRGLLGIDPPLEGGWAYLRGANP